jgi:hypothetical protein
LSAVKAGLVEATVNASLSLRIQSLLYGVIAASLLLGLLSRSVAVGIGKVPYETTDSRGRAMGFNDPLSREHLGIILRQVRPADLLGEGVLDAVYFTGSGHGRSDVSTRDAPAGSWRSSRCSSRCSRWG